MATKICEVCEKNAATWIVEREWDDGSIDRDLVVCSLDSNNDPDGKWTILRKTRINTGKFVARGWEWLKANEPRYNESKRTFALVQDELNELQPQYDRYMELFNKSIPLLHIIQGHEEARERYELGQTSKRANVEKSKEVSAIAKFKALSPERQAELLKLMSKGGK